MRFSSFLDQLQFDFDSGEIGKITQKALREARISVEKARPEIEKSRAELDKMRS
jgi:hypothetical protein